jgi:broad specificity phosphatase PhoE
MSLRRLILIRHGETEGQSSVRFFGSTDVDLSESGRAEMRRAGNALREQEIGLWVASNQRRSWRGAAIASEGARLVLEADFREIHFGRWEGMTREEIQASDPVRYEDWQKAAGEFEFPDGESREAFRARVGRGLARLLAAPVHTAAGVLHKGVIREIVRQQTGEVLPRPLPEIGAALELTRTATGVWILGRRSSDPPGLENEAA